MAKVKLGLRGLSASEKILLAKEIVAKMTGNANFPSPNPLMFHLNNGITDLETALTDAATARDTAMQKTLVANEKEADLEALLTQEAAYVETAANGDEEKIISAGMDVRDQRTPPSMPAQPQAMALTAGDHEGTLDAAWDPVNGAKSYTMQISTVSGTGPWTHAGVAVKSTAKLAGQSPETPSALTPGQRVWVRVAAIGSAGQGPWSDPATKIVP